MSKINRLYNIPNWPNYFVDVSGDVWSTYKGYLNKFKPLYENHPMAKLKNKEVIYIKQKLKEGIKRTDLAKVFNVCKGTIDQIAQGKCWSSINTNGG